MEEKWSIRAYREGDEEGVLELSKAVYPEETYVLEDWMKRWHWTYKENPAGAARIWLADDDGRIVGQYPLIFMMVKVGNEIVKAYQNIDIMTHPNYRGQGIFSKLERHALDEAVSEGVHITIGFTNEAAYPGHIKSGWFDIAPTQILFKPLHWGNALTAKISNKFLLQLGALAGNSVDRMLFRAKRTPVVEGLTITQATHFDERINHLWTRISSQHQITVVRNKDYLNWRYVAVPDVDYVLYVAEKAGEIRGYLVLRCIQREFRKVGIILDILAESEQIAQFLVSKAIEHSKQEKVDLIYCNLIANKTYLGAFRRNGFISVPFVKGGPFCAYSSSPHIPKEFLRDSKNWFIQIGDSLID